MILGRVAGTIVATRKDPRLEGFKLLLSSRFRPKATTNPGT
jgi:microcompartment protein CcmK/EutM